MGRGKTQKKYIENGTNRHVTFSKRRNGMLKKARELSILCSSEVALMIISERGKLSEYANISVRQTIERYREAMRTQRNNRAGKQQSNSSNPEKEAGTAAKHDKQALEKLSKKYADIRAYKRKLFGQDFDACSQDERHEFASKIEATLHNVGVAKMRQFQCHIEKRAEEKNLLARENEELRQKLLAQKNVNIGSGSGSNDNNNNSKHCDFDINVDLSLAMPGQGEVSISSTKSVS